MGKRFVMFPYRDMICDDCKNRGFPESIYYFYSHFWGMGDDHICPPLTKKEIEKIVKEICKDNKNEEEFSLGGGI